MNEETVEVIKSADYRIGTLRSFDYSAFARSGGAKRETPETAPEVPVVLAAIRLIAESVGTLPLHLYRTEANGAKTLATDHPLYKILRHRPNAEQTSLELRETLVMLYLLYGNAFCEIKRDERGVVSALEALHPSRMEVTRIADGTLRYVYKEPDHRETVYQPSQILHIRMPSLDGLNGMCLTNLVRDAIAHARALEAHGLQFFSNFAKPQVVLSSENAIPVEAQENLANQWRRLYSQQSGNAYKTAIMPHGLKVTELNASMESSQFLEARRFAVIEVARAFKIPPHLLQSLDGATYTNIESQGREFVTYTLLPHLRRIEDAIARDLLGDDVGVMFCEHDVHAFMRGDTAARAAWYQQMQGAGVLSINEIRQYEGLNPIGPEGDERFMQLSYTTVKRIVDGADNPPQEG